MKIDKFNHLIYILKKRKTKLTMLFSGPDSAVGSRIECRFFGVGNRSNSSGTPRKFEAYLRRNFMCWLNRRHVCITSISHGN
jgi:hypothetical protein